MPLKRISELRTESREVHRTSNYVMKEVSYQNQDGVDLQLTSLNNKFDKLVSFDVIGTSLEIHILKLDLVTYEECENLGKALSELSEFLDVIEENY